VRAALCLLIAACSAASPAPTVRPAPRTAPVARERPVYERFGYRVVDVQYLPYAGMSDEPAMQHTRDPADAGARTCLKRAASELAAFLTADPPKLRRLLEVGGFTQNVVLRLDDYSHAQYRFTALRDARLLWGDNVWTWNATLDDKSVCKVPTPGAATAALGNLLFKLDPDQPDDRKKPTRLEVVVREYGSERPLPDLRIGIHELLVCPQWQDEDKCPVPGRLTAVTDENGTARFDLPHPLWAIDGIKLDGYVTECPHHDQSDTETAHYLNEDSHEGYISPRTTHRYVCRLVRPSVLRVNSANAAIRIAKSIPEVRAWVVQHPEADTTARSEVTSWEVTGMIGDRWVWRVVIDAFDGSYYSNGP